LATGSMTYLQHLEELRRRLIVGGLAVLVAFAVGWIFAWDILNFLKEPAGSLKLYYMTPMEPFLVRFKLAMFGAVILALPVILFEILAFVSPALKRKEKTYTFGVLGMIVVFFAAGVAFGYKVIMPAGITWLLNVAQGQMTSVISASSYVNFAGWFMLGMGVAFETPVFIWMLVALGVVKPEQLRSQWRWAVLIILLAASIITPDWSPVTMVLVAIPMAALYVFSIALAYFTTRKRRARAAAEALGTAETS
jgi:sec-independent protein translocase protein TatC